MVSRRALLASTAVLAAGCGFLDSPSEAPVLMPGAELIWAASTSFYSLVGTTHGVSPLEKYQQTVATLARDGDSPHGFKRGKYNLTLRHAGQWPSRDEYAAWLEDLEADIVTVSSEDARAMGERGVLLPLDRFSGADGRPFDQEFYPSVLSQFQRGALYALPVGARPLMLYYDAAYFRREGVAPVNSNWDWNDLVVNAAELTKRKADGTVVRWGLATHSVGLWWALWQNEADVVDLGTLQCRLQEPGAIEALQFFRDLLHTHRVSPVLYRDLFELIHQSGNPPAMVYELSPRRPFHGDFRLAELPRGKVRAVPVYADMGIAIAARTANPEAAYTALKGLAHVMQQHVNVPTQREAVAKLGELRKDLHPEEVTALQQSMEHGHGWPQTGAQYGAIRYLVEALVGGDDVATVVNRACSLVREYQ